MHESPSSNYILRNNDYINYEPNNDRRDVI